MCYHLKTPSGGTEAVIDDNCGISKFYSIAGTLSDELNVKFIKKVDDADSISWDFKYKKNLLTLSYSIFNGISILPGNLQNNRHANKAVEDIALLLVKRAY
jgi:hypothetical protein